jgi:Tfp pilus assembly protein PilF
VGVNFSSIDDGEWALFDTQSRRKQKGRRALPLALRLHLWSKREKVECNYTSGSHRIMKSYISCFSLVLVSFAPCAEAQFESHKNVSVSGELQTSRPSDTALVIVLSSPGEPDRRADVPSGGAFEFSGVLSGEYELQVTTLYGQVLHKEYVTVSSTTYRLLVRLPDENVERPTFGTVSAAKLRHKVPPKARKEFEKGVEASRKNDTAAAIGHLTMATELDPDFMEAHNNLGVQHLKCAWYEPALAHFQKAAELDAGARSPLVNIAATLMGMDRFEEAETAARKAIRLGGVNATARYMLGLALLQQKKNTPEALDNLKRASDTVPRARLAIAEFLEKSGDVERARTELRAYLDSKPKDRQSVENWLAELK